MLAGVLHGSRDVRVETISPPAPSTGQVLLRVRRVGICGSDVHYFDHGYCGAFVPSRPFILGHELVATVEAIGHDVTWPLVGDRVVVNPATSCGQCEACKSGRGNLCRFVTMLGSASTDPPTDGAFAEFVVTAAHQCHPIPDSVSDGVAAMMEPLSVVLHAIRRSGGVSGARVLVMGGGPIGIITAITARAYGANIVAVCEPVESRRALALSFGADRALDPTGDHFGDQIRAAGGGYDVVFEASGAAASVKATFDLVRRGGTIVQIGTVGGNLVPMPVNDLMVQEISLVGTFRYANEFPDAIRLVASQRVDLSPLVTNVMLLAEISQALMLASTDKKELKVQLSVG